MHTVVLPIHIAAGALALASGYLALYAAKGAGLHRRSGVLFVYAMVTMSLTGAFIAAAATSSISVSVVAGLVTFYIVTTGYLTVRTRHHAIRRLDGAATLFGALVAVLAFRTAFQLAGSGRPETAPMFIFGIAALLAAAGDVRVMRAGGIDGARRIARHVWRMCFPMWVAAASFFWGPQGRVPEVIRIPPLLAVAVMTPIAAMLYWLWRVRGKRGSRTISRLGLPKAA